MNLSLTCIITIVTNYITMSKGEGEEREEGRTFSSKGQNNSTAIIVGVIVVIVLMQLLEYSDNILTAFAQGP
jgi:hypothetical protein